MEVAHVAADAASADAAATVAAAAEAFGAIDIVVHQRRRPADGGSDGDRSRRRGSARFQLLAATPIELATRLLPGMRERGWGRVVSILSSGVRQPIGDLVYSNAGRAVLAAWLKTTARAIAGEGVTLNGVMPGRLATPRIHELDSGARRARGQVRGGGAGGAHRHDSGRPLRQARRSSARSSRSSPRNARRT